MTFVDFLDMIRDRQGVTVVEFDPTPRRNRARHASAGAGRTAAAGRRSIPHDTHAVGHSDADVLLHAVTDALLGAASLGDIGELFPDTDPAHKGATRRRMLTHGLRAAAGPDWRIVNVDCIVFLERPKLGHFKNAIRMRIAELLEIPAHNVGVKAKTGEGLDAVGREEAIAAQCVALLERTAPRRAAKPQAEFPTDH